MLAGQGSRGSRLLYPSVFFTALALLCCVFYFYSPHVGPSNFAAVVIETNPPSNLNALVLHFAAVLGPQWKIIIYTLEENWTTPQSPSIQRAIASNTVEIRFLPPGTDFPDGRVYSRFLTSPWLWEQLSDASRVLMFQTDSMICSNSPRKIDDYLQYDFIGAPIDPSRGRGYNGGLSLRNPQIMLAITQAESNEGNEWEDRWFFNMLESRLEEGVVLPSVEVAKTFAVETMFYETPLGYHQAFRWLPEEYKSAIEAWCPEIGMAGQKRTPP